MKRSLMVVIPALLLVLIANLFARTPAKAQDGSTVLVRDDPALGQILTDKDNKTLYLFTKDTEGVSNCYDKCAENWPIFSADEPLTLPEGVAGTLSTITRTDGTTQVAYNGYPLYYWAHDAAAGDTTGQAVGNVWWVVRPGQEWGKAIQTAPTVLVSENEELGNILTDSWGRTLYLFTKDTEPGVSTCYDKCEENWPIFTAEEPLTLPEGVDGTLSLITRTDGTTQVAYNDIPLYYFAKDEKAGDTNGQGVGDVWWIVAPGQQFGQPAATPVASPEASPMAATEGEKVDVTLMEFMVESSSTDLEANEPYTFVISNTGSATHEFVIEPAGVEDQPLEANGEEAEVEDIAPGTSQSLTWTFTEPGDYQIACHVPGHYQQGMVIEVHVS